MNNVSKLRGSCILKIQTLWNRMHEQLSNAWMATTLLFNMRNWAAGVKSWHKCSRGQPRHDPRSSKSDLLYRSISTLLDRTPHSYINLRHRTIKNSTLVLGAEPTSVKRKIPNDPSNLNFALAVTCHVHKTAETSAAILLVTSSEMLISSPLSLSV